MKKRIAAVILAVVMVLSFGMTAMAASGTWQNDGYGWWYAYDGGGYPAGTWESIDGQWYHFDNSGYMQTGWVWDGYAWYYMNPDGTMATSWVWDGANWYYMNEDGTMYTGWLLYNGNAYYMLDSGVMATGWAWVSNYFNPEYHFWAYFDDNGVSHVGWLYDGGRWYYLREISLDYKAGISTGMLVVNQPVIEYERLETGQSRITAAYMLDQYGAWVSTPGWYYLASGGGEDGYARDAYDYDNWYYIGEDGMLVTGWLQDGNAWYYMMPRMAKATAFRVIGPDDIRLYLFDENGVLLDTDGWHMVRGKWAYVENGACALGWKEIDGVQYYFMDGITELPAVTSDGYMLRNGMMAYDTKVKLSGQVYYFDQNGQVTKVEKDPFANSGIGVAGGGTPFEW